MKTHDPLAGETWSRRDFLRGMNAAALAALAGGEPRLVRGAEPLKQPEPTADTIILLWLAGGMAAPETFDPKRYTPFEVGVPSEKILCTFPAIDTAVDGVKISQGLEHVAKVLDRGTLIRSHVVADLGNILHSRHQYHWHTGYVPPQTVAAPHLGSWIAKVRGPQEPGDPGVHQHRPAAGGARRGRGAQGVHHRRVLRQRVRPVQYPLPARRDGRRATAQGGDPRAVRPPREDVPPAGQGGPAGRPGERLPSRVGGASDGQRLPVAELAGARRV